MDKRAGPDRAGERYCSFCGQEIAPGEGYWYINGWTVCVDCLPNFAREDYRPFCHIQGEEEWD